MILIITNIFLFIITIAALFGSFYLFFGEFIDKFFRFFNGNDNRYYQPPENKSYRDADENYNDFIQRHKK